MRDKYERETFEASSIYALLKKQDIFLIFSNYIEYKDFVHISSLNKRFG